MNETSPLTVNLLLNETSPLTVNLLLNETSSLTINFLLNETSLYTNNLLLNETSPLTINFLLIETSSNTNRFLSKEAFSKTNILFFNVVSSEKFILGIVKPPAKSTLSKKITLPFTNIPEFMETRSCIIVFPITSKFLLILTSLDIDNLEFIDTSPLIKSR